MENLNLLFYKTFYSKLGAENTVFENDLTAKANKLVASKFYEDDYKSAAVNDQIAPNRFLMKTLYPGLLVGTGYAHGVSADSDIKVGFSFDYVTGQPYIPGSSVKGLLRSYFEHTEVIKSLIEKECNDKIVNAMKHDIFEDDDESSDNKDIFFDAVVRCGDGKGFVMGYDSITSHGNDLTKNPVPIKILKILPDVILEFSFQLKDFKFDEFTLTAKEKENLFKKILCLFGIGAKTNVGYGVLEAVTESEVHAYPSDPTREPIEDNYYTCTITDLPTYGILVNLDQINRRALIHKSQIPDVIFNNLSKYYKRGDKLVSKILEIKDEKINMSYECAK